MSKKSLEEEILDKKYWRIGWAIMHMSKLERLLWAIGFGHKYMTNKFWEDKP